MSDDQPPLAVNAAEDVTAKYKRLLSLARTSLEANQKQLAEKDHVIAELTVALDEERSKRQASRSHKDDEYNQIYPRRVLCRVEVEGMIWILLEYESAEDDWKHFTDELALQDYIKRIPGAPLIVPQKCLSVEESSRLAEESRAKVDRISEEFRRYKVKMEIALKQREAESRPSSFASTMTVNNRSPHHHATNYVTGGLSSTLEKALSQGNMNGNSNSSNGNSALSPHNSSSNTDETAKLQQMLTDREKQWRVAYETVAKELEQLKQKGADSVVAAQWRSRYEGLLRDKEELLQRLALHTQLSSEVHDRGKSVDQLYVELQEEYKSLRKRLKELIQEVMIQSDRSSAQDQLEQLLQELGSVIQSYHIDHKDLDDSRLLHPIKGSSSASSCPRMISAAAAAAGEGIRTTTGGMAESKVQYVKQMVYQFLICREPEVKSHIESALIALFRFSEEEKMAIESRNKEDEQQDTLSSITSFLGSFAVSTT